jgi:hypothetical protein
MEAQERYVGRLLPNMDVCDVAGQKIGSIARVYRDELALAMSATGGPAESVPERPRHPEIMEVKTGLLGLGEHLYIPIDAVQDVTEECVLLSVKKDEVASEWHHTPDYLGELQ